MFDESVMDESRMDESNMSLDLGNLSTIFGGSGNKPNMNKIPEAIKEMDEEEEDGWKSSMFANNKFEKESKISDATSVFNQE